MTRLALIDLTDKSVVREVATGGWVELPNGSSVAPAVAGWQGGGYITYAKTEGGEQAVEGPPRYAFVEIDGFVAPKGARAMGTATLAFDAKTAKVIETVAVTDEPEVLPTAGERVAALLAGFDLTLDELRSVLADRVNAAAEVGARV